MAGDHVARIRKWHELIERHGSDEAAHYAIRESPEWAMTFELYPFHLLDEGRRTLALDLMLAADATSERLPFDEQADGGSDEAPARSLPPLPNKSQLKSFTHASLEKAVKSFDADGTRGDVVRDAKLSPHDARRVRLMRGVHLLRLNADRKLVVSERVARKGSRYVLRYLDESGTRWLDPNVELRGR